MRRKLSFLLLAVVCSLSALAQSVIKGTVIDKDTKEPLIGVSVFSESSKAGTSTDLDGSFELKVPSIGGKLVLTYVGYKTKEMKSEANVGTVELESDAVVLQDAIVTSSVAIKRKTPVAISVIEPEILETKLGTQEFPEILKSTPGVYATKQGGGFGDSRINLRGFENENIAVMVNGVPVNDMLWGGIYWSNWSGLSDVTRSKQVQRGIGASKLSAPSVGGSINIVTRNVDAKKGGFVSYGMGNDNYNKLLFSVSTGLTDNGWAVTFLGGKTWGDGYIQGTDFEGYTYFLNVAKQFNENHLLSLTAVGSPQWHYQRKDDLTIAGWQQQSEKYKFNPAYGFGPNGERKKGTSYNEYHKPQITLNHSWTINEKSSLSTSLYTSIGQGYGMSGQGLTNDDRNAWYATSNEGILNTRFRAADGTFDYGAIYALNQASLNGSVMATAKNMNNHNWYGLISSYTTKLTDYIELNGGIDLRYYKGTHKAELYDLYGGKYYLDKTSRSSVSYQKGNEDWINQKLYVGDVVYRNYNSFVFQTGVFGQAEYNKDKLAVVAAGTINNNAYWRKDYFYYDAANRKSETKSFIGYTLKGGANYNLDEKNNVFANVGYISRAPFYSGGVFLQAEKSNLVNKKAVNEKVISFEVGYGFRTSAFAANVNLYHTNWRDKTTTSSLEIPGSDDRGKVNLTGVNAIHKGIEFDFEAHPTKDLKLTGMLSFGDWTWDSNASGYAYDSQGQPLNKDGGLASGIAAPDHYLVAVDLKGVKVGNSAQTTFALGANYRVLGAIRLGMDYTYFARNYAGFKIKTNGENITPWRMPSAGQLDASASFDFKIGGLKSTIYGNVLNLTDNTYITDATDGSDHTAKTAQVYYAFGRTYSVRLKVNF